MIFSSFKIDDSKKFYNEFHSLAAILDEDNIKNQIYKNIECRELLEESDIVDYYLCKLAIILKRHFESAIETKVVNIYARVDNLFSRNFELIPHSVWDLCEITSWEKGVAESPEGQKLYDIHFCLNKEIGHDSFIAPTFRVRPQFEKAKSILQILYKQHPRLNNPAITDSKIMDLVNNYLLKNEPSERPISRMTVVEAMKEIWGKK